MAYALRGFRQATLLGADTDALVCRRAEAAGAVHRAFTDPMEVMERADLLLFCVYAHHIPGLLQAGAARLKPGALLGDICGVKAPLYAKIAPLLPEGVDYVGVHPMAGKERDGFENAEAGLYRNSGFIITALPCSSAEGVETMRALASHIGATRLSVCSPEEHDAMIAYTSDLMHIAAAGLCLHPKAEMNPAFTAGAFRDCTRVADINADAWTELLLDNRSHITGCLAQYMADLGDIKAALEQNSAPALRSLLHKAGENKRELLHK
jgi:prephenate dehydrogenase